MRRGLTAAALVALLASGCGGAGADDWRLAFRSDRDGRWSVYAVRPDATGLVRILDLGSEYGTPIPSPDGRKLIMPAENALIVANVDGRRRKRLAGAGFGGEGTWSPDSKRIVFSGLSPGFSIIDADGSNGRRLTRNLYDFGEAWSPDGKWIAYSRDNLLLVAEVDGPRRRLLTSGEGIGDPRWSPSGREIFFVRNYSEPPVGTSFYAITPDAMHERTVAGLPEDWSPDRRRMVFTRWVGGDEYAGHYEVYVADARGENARRLTFGRRRESSVWPTWSRDGRRIVYAREGRFGLHELWAMNPDGSGKRPLTRAYPQDGASDPVGWVQGDLPAVPVPAPRVTGSMLRVPWPVDEIAADGDRLAAIPPGHFSETVVPTPPLLLWSVADGGVSRTSLSACLAPRDLALTGARVVFNCAGHAPDIIVHELDVVPLTKRVPVSLFEGGNRGPYPLGGIYISAIIGHGGAVVVGRHRTDRDGRPRGWTVSRLVGRRLVRIDAGPTAGVPTAVDGSRILVERADGRLAVLTFAGRVARELPTQLPPRRDSAWGSPPARALLEGGVAIVKDGARLLVFGRRARAWPVPARARLKALSSGLVAYVAARRVHVLRLSDGRETVFVPAGRGATIDADLTSRGLFYSYNLRRERSDAKMYVANAGRIVFVPRAALVRRLTNP